jgi:anti-sigma factor (TIGR02949 family)
MLHEYLRRELTPETAQQVKQHLEDCRPCLGHARFEENYLAMLEAKVKAQGCPDAVRGRILAVLRQTTQDQGE